jgi:hypothetical protein
MTRPPDRRAKRQAIRKVRACPKCSPPVGEGASRPTTPGDDRSGGFSVKRYVPPE